MIPKGYICFYENWYYKKTDDQYEAREFGKIETITAIDKTDIRDFIKKLIKAVPYGDNNLSVKNLKIITRKYPWIKLYHREIISRLIRKAIIQGLFITAIKENDEAICNCILDTYHLTKQDSLSWKLDVLDGYNKVELDQIKYGERYYRIQSNESNRNLPNVISYKRGNKYTIVNGKRYIISVALKNQLNEAEDVFQNRLKDAMSEQNGYHLADFKNGRLIAFKQLDCDKYHFLIIKKNGDKLARFDSVASPAIEFINSFSFSRWGFVLEKSGIDLNNFPLYDRAKDVKDIFLEYEIKYLAGVATQEEMDYLNAHDSEDEELRFYLKKDVYDIDDVCILEVVYKIKMWVGRIKELKIIIDGKARMANFCHYTDGSESLIVHSYYKRLECKITKRLANRIKELFNKIK